MDRLLEFFSNNQTVLYVMLGFLALIIISLIYIIIETKKLSKASKVQTNEQPIEFHKVEDETKSNDKNIQLDSLLEQMQKDLEKNNMDQVSSFEYEQEEKAIISYQELLNASKNKQKTVEQTTNIVDNNQISNNEHFVNEKKEDKKFRNTEFISPIYGRLDNNIEYPKIPAFREKNIEKTNNIELEKTLNIEPLREEIKKNERFLEALKEFRKNLE